MSRSLIDLSTMDIELEDSCHCFPTINDPIFSSQGSKGLTDTSHMSQDYDMHMPDHSLSPDTLPWEDDWHTGLFNQFLQRS